MKNFSLVTHNGILSLLTPNGNHVHPDFHYTDNILQKLKGTQTLIQACKPRGKIILDATAGLGKDASLLALSGAKQVSMIERNTTMQQLLEDALNRQSLGDRKRIPLSLIKEDAIIYLKNLTQDLYPDIIYLDPMHPERQKSALVKENMQALQTLIGPDIDAKILLETALLHVKEKVVVKWPAKIAPLMNPNHSIKGKTTRYDVFLPK